MSGAYSPALLHNKEKALHETNTSRGLVDKKQNSRNVFT